MEIQKYSMISDGYAALTGFLKAIEEKDFSEIISFADKEALAAWRRAYRQNKESAARTVGDLPDRYEHALEELISFLRAALPYRPLLKWMNRPVSALFAAPSEGF